MLAISIRLHWIRRIRRLLPLSKVITRTTISSSLRINAKAVISGEWGMCCGWFAADALIRCR